MKRLYVTIAAVLLIGALPILALARYAGPKCPQPQGPMGCYKMEKGQMGACRIGLLLKSKDKLELTDEQVQKLEAIKAEFADKCKAAYDAVMAKKLALREAVKSTAPADTIRAAANELGVAIGDKAVLKAETKAKVDAILTDAQKTKLQELQEQRREWMQHKRGKGPWTMCPCPKDPEGVFKKIDTNGDGTISLEEFKAHTEQMKACRIGKGPMPVEPPDAR